MKNSSTIKDKKNSTCQNKKEEEKQRPVSEKIVLVKTATCPNCKMAANLLDKQGVIYEKIDANENKDFCEEYGIKQAPTLVVFEQDKIQKITNVSNIKKYIMEVYQNV